MFIISKHKDYYDGVAYSMGIDKTIIYERNTIMVDDRKLFPKQFGSGDSLWRNDKTLYSKMYNLGGRIVGRVKDGYFIAPFVVFFCGKTYPGYKAITEKRVNFSTVTEIEYFYDVNNLLKYLVYKKENVILNRVTEYHETVKNFEFLDVYRDNNTPVMIFDFNSTNWRRNDNKFIINPILSEYEFYKVIDSFTAFQEIQMFLGGVLGSKENEIITISNKDKIVQHGFDYVWSFRKEPKN